MNTETTIIALLFLLILAMLRDNRQPNRPAPTPVLIVPSEPTDTSSIGRMIVEGLMVVGGFFLVLYLVSAQA